MNEKQSIDYLIEYLESYLMELGHELQSDPENLFLQGKVHGIQHALRYVRMHGYAGKNSHQIDIEID
ncbi:hypothetical protein [Paenibacillus xylaniclasticus]|uniref:hypothetical protein n=1 Tax=Paenibacillus xylaniclasticus TaxID=588083 RepID=UPI000FD816AB|nr:MULTISPECIES: hypothetical protein [Paenibacillus]GFN33858.1 hypothetical protein PCURB6_41180 [Paenibacillus curdlanolyticus]